MEIIEINEMEFYAFHGHLKEERVVGNRFLIDLKIEADCLTAAKSDNLDDAVNYKDAYDIVKKQMKKKSHLLENIAKRILDALYENIKGIKKVTVKVQKLNPPIDGIMKSVSITMSK